MTFNLIESIQKNLGYPALHKIDPNTLQAKVGESEKSSRHFGQAAIPAVLLGLYKYASTEHGADEVLKGSVSSGWTDVFFGNHKAEAVEKVAEYTGANTSLDETGHRMDNIANEAVKLIRQNLPAKASFMDVKNFMAQQRNKILVYLPAELQMGKVVNDNTLDDRTTKMEGPMSSHMHFFEKLFSGSSTEKNERDGYDDIK